ncbi:glutathione S-transferase [Aliivibrio kagoshimensis]|uniref:glutathione S-transferase n=1 Tax=Aliivibrio kagoshimensis TaxID=2910230 RepID=UPI003D137833
MTHPILYSLRQCPYAMRARLGILLAQQQVLLRDIVMKNKPNEMLISSPKATVPVLVLNDGQVIDESLDIMTWALSQHDPQSLLGKTPSETLPDMLTLIEKYDEAFVNVLKKYKAAARYHDPQEEAHRQQCEPFIQELENRLTLHRNVMGEALSLVDYAILPFIRQFTRVDKKWFVTAPYPHLQNWLERHYQNPLFSKAMKKYPQWLENRETIIFG